MRRAGAIALALLALGAPQAHAVSAASLAGRTGAAARRLSREAQQVADWIAASHDNQGRPYAIVDKAAAEVFVFDAQGGRLGAAPVLLGLAKGDDTVPGIGDMKLADIRADQRTTPAGRFVAVLGRNADDHEILWVDYDAAISMHAVITGTARDRRLHRLETASPLDNRISFGCINVPVKFYESVVSPAFSGEGGVVYILPEMKSIQAVFPGAGLPAPRN